MECFQATVQCEDGNIPYPCRQYGRGTCCLGNNNGKRIGKYAAPKTTRISDKATWIASNVCSVSMACWIDVLESVPRIREKKRRRVSSIGWNTIRAIIEPEEVPELG